MGKMIEVDGKEIYIFGRDNLPHTIVGKVIKPKRERSEQLTVNNATKEQLKWMLRDRERETARQYREIEELKKQNERLLDLFCNAAVFINDTHGGDVCKKVLDGEYRGKGN